MKFLLGYKMKISIYWGKWTFGGVKSTRGIFPSGGNEQFSRFFPLIREKLENGPLWKETFCE